jgi:hypothetical protein
MGDEGDHWPVINSTVDRIMKDWEEQQIERNVDAELKQHYSDILAQMEVDLALCPPDLRSKAEKVIKNIRELIEARFGPIDATLFVVCDADIPIHIKRAEAIIRTLEDHNGQI